LVVEAGPVPHIRAALERLAARAALLAGLRAGAGLVGGACAGLLLASGIASAGGPPLLAAGVGITALIVAGGVGLVAPLLPAWRARGDLLVHARLVEALRPELDQRLVTVAGRLIQPRGAGGAGSDALLQRAARRADDVLRDLPAARVYPLDSLRLPGLIAAGAVLLTVLAALFAPVGPVEALAMAVAPGGAPVEGAGPVDPNVRAVVGDIELRYVFPAHTGNPPVTVKNSDGTIHAPVGTVVEVRARTLERYDSAALELDGQVLGPADLVAGRELLATLTVERAGTWRFALAQGEARVLSPDYKVEVDEDAAPVVALERPPGPTPAADAPLGVAFSVQDDFGVTKLAVEIEDEQGNLREVPLRELLDQPREVQGVLGLSPRQLGLPIGQRSKLRIVAYDNDVGGGNKKGASATLEITPLGPRGQGERLEAYLQKLRDALVDVLAAHLLDPSPPAAEASAAMRWAEGAQGRLDEVARLRAAQWGDEGAGTLDGPLLDEVFTDAGRLYRFVLTTWEPGSGRSITPADTAQVSALQADLVLALEQAIYVIDAALRAVALQELSEAADNVAAEARELAAVADKAEIGELLARLDQLTRMLDALNKAAAALSDADLKEFVNSRTGEASQLMDQIRAALEEGRVEDARELMKQLAEQLQQMSESLGDRMASQQQDADELKDALKKTLEGMEKLEADQRALAEQLRKKREDLGDEVGEEVAAWAKIDKALRELLSQADALEAAVGDGRGYRIDVLRRAERAIGESRAVEAPVRGRDPVGALDRTLGATPLTEAARRLIGAEAARSRAPGEPSPAALPAAQAAAAGAVAQLRLLRELLEPMAQEGESESPEVQEAARELSARQSELAERREQLEGELRRVERALPTAQGKATAEMERAGESMERAEDALSQGEAMKAEGNQGAAADQVKAAREALQQALQQQQQQQQAQREMRGQQQQDQPNGKEEGDSSAGQDQLLIPPPEAFRTPEAYRRALLEGMSGDVPEEYEALKQRYFEELVRQ
jgi:hypothetical protein